MHPDSTPLPVAESTERFAVDDQRRSGAAFVSSGSSVRASDDRRSVDAFTPLTNRGVKWAGDIPTINNPDSVPIKVSSFVDDVRSRVIPRSLPSPAVALPSSMVPDVFPDAPVLLDANVDWLTLTSTELDGIEQLRLIGLHVGCELVRLGETVREAREYKFYKGESYGRHLFIGISENQGVLLRASSTVALPVLQMAAFVPDRKFKATRVDIQNTVQYPDPPGRGFFRDLSDGSHLAATTKQGKGRPWQVALRDEYGRGDTVYVAARTSEAYGRVYDKGRESPEYYAPGAVRYEVESKGSQGEQMMDVLCEKRERSAEWIAGYVAGWYASHGVSLPVDLGVLPVLRTVPHYTDAERRLKWIETGVSPSMGQLVAAGHTERLIEALGAVVVDAIVEAKLRKAAVQGDL